MTSIPWWQLLLASLTSVASMAGMLNLAPLLPVIREELGLTNAWTGMLAAATLLSHTLLQLPSGQFVAIVGAKRGIGVALLLIGLSLLLSSMALTFPFLLLCRLLLGVGTAVSFMAGLGYINTLVSPERRVVAQGIYGAGGNAGTLLVMLGSERLAALMSWRGSFAAEGVVILGVAWLSLARLRPEGKRRPMPSTRWGDTLREGTLYLLGLAHICTYGTFMALATWMPTFLWEERGIGLEWAGPLAALLVASAVVGRVTGGALATGRERQAVLVSCFVTSAGTGLAALLPGIVPTVLVLLVLGAFASAPFGATYSYGSVLTGREVSSQALSLINFIANLGALLSPPAIGLALDAAGSFALGFGLVAAFGLASSTLVALSLPKPRGEMQATRSRATSVR